MFFKPSTYALASASRSNKSRNTHSHISTTCQLRCFKNIIGSCFLATPIQKVRFHTSLTDIATVLNIHALMMRHIRQPTIGYRRLFGFLPIPHVWDDGYGFLLQKHGAEYQIAQGSDGDTMFKRVDLAQTLHRLGEIQTATPQNVHVRSTIFEQFFFHVKDLLTLGVIPPVKGLPRFGFHTIRVVVPGIWYGSHIVLVCLRIKEMRKVTFGQLGQSKCFGKLGQLSMNLISGSFTDNSMILAPFMIKPGRILLSYKYFKMKYESYPLKL